jgi:hypothetical protein
MPGIVSNSPPLIHLAKIDELQLLHNFYEQVLIPQAVYDECVTEGKAYKDAGPIAQADWLAVKGVEDRNLVILLNAELDRGESEAIALALQEQSDLLLLDDAEGREKARLYGLKYTGTVGILLRAKLTNKLPSLRNALDRLQDTGFWLDNRLYQKLLQEAGE